MDLGGTKREREWASSNCIASVLRPVGRLTGDNKGEDAASLPPFAFKTKFWCSCTLLKCFHFIHFTPVQREMFNFFHQYIYLTTEVLCLLKCFINNIIKYSAFLEIKPLVSNPFGFWPLEKKKKYCSWGFCHISDVIAFPSTCFYVLFQLVCKKPEWKLHYIHVCSDHWPK